MRKRPSYGQHFLHDRNILSAIVSAAGLEKGDSVLEIGVGTGRLTEMILAQGVTVTGVEVDAKLFPTLQGKFGAHSGLKLVKGDILRLPWEEILPCEGKTVIMGNLPYAVSTQIIFKAIEHRKRIDKAVFLVQWEVGARMAARPRSRDYGIISVACQMFGKPEVLRKIPPTVFLPPPKVDSALVRWDLFEDVNVTPADRQYTMDVVRASFGQRRKKLVNSLAAGMPGAGKSIIIKILLDMGLKETVRAEELTVGQFTELAVRLQTATK